MSYDFTLTALIPAPPRDVYDAWLDGKRHAAMTGGKAVMSDKVGAAVSAWDGYITGRNVALVPGKRIVQTWRTSQFASTHPDSTITVTLAPVKVGTRLTLTHSGVPDGQTSYENGGWQDSYFAPMATYFARARAAAKAKGRKAAKRPAKKKAASPRKATKKARAKK